MPDLDPTTLAAILARDGEPDIPFALGDESPAVTFVELALLDDGTLPSERELFPRGAFETKKGRFVFDDASASAVMEAFNAHGVDLPFDYDHKMLNPDAPPENGKAAGWFRLVVREGALWATNIQWTPAAAEAIRAREFRYVSPAFLAKRDSGQIVRLINVALTNLPATVGIRPLVARDTTTDDATTATVEITDHTAEKSNVMNEILAALLGCECTEAAITAALKAKAEEHAAALSDLKRAREIVGLTDSEVALSARLIELTAAASKLDALTAKLTEVEAKLTEAGAKLTEIAKAEAEAEVSWIITTSERYGLGKFSDTEAARAMLLAQRAAAPDAFATVYRVALDGRAAGDTAAMFTATAHAPDASESTPSHASGGDATASVIERASEIAKRDKIPMSAAMLRAVNATAKIGG